MSSLNEEDVKSLESLVCGFSHICFQKVFLANEKLHSVDCSVMDKRATEVTRPVSTLIHIYYKVQRAIGKISTVRKNYLPLEKNIYR